MAARLRAAGARVELVALPGSEHGFLGETPDATRRDSRDALARSFAFFDRLVQRRSEEHTSELQSLMRISYAVFCLKKKQNSHCNTKHNITHLNNRYISNTTVPQLIKIQSEKT